MIIAIEPADLLIIKDWQQVRIINDANHGNKHKFWIKKVPGYDNEKFPFLICSGINSFNLINVKTCKTETLIQASSHALSA